MSTPTSYFIPYENVRAMTRVLIAESWKLMRFSFTTSFVRSR